MTEEELIANCRLQNPKYQRILVEQYASMLMATCLRYCKNRADAEDCIQEAWINVFKAIDKYQPSGSFKAWIQRIGINCCLSHYRKSASIIRIETNQLSRPSHQSPLVYAAMNADEIIKLLHKLTDTKRQVFTLYVVEGYKHAEIAEMIGVTESTSRSILTRARQEIKELINSYDKALEL